MSLSLGRIVNEFNLNQYLILLQSDCFVLKAKI